LSSSRAIAEKKGGIKMRKILVLLAIVVFLGGCTFASTKYLVEKDKWPKFQVIVLEELKLGPSVNIPTNVLETFNQVIFTELKEKLKGNYQVVREENNRSAAILRISGTLTKWREIRTSTDFTGEMNFIGKSREGEILFESRQPVGGNTGIYSRRFIFTLWAKRVAKNIEKAFL